MADKRHGANIALEELWLPGAPQLQIFLGLVGPEV